MDVIATMAVEDPLVVIMGAITEGTTIIRFGPLLFEREMRVEKSTHTHTHAHTAPCNVNHQPSFADACDMRALEEVPFTPLSTGKILHIHAGTKHIRTCTDTSDTRNSTSFFFISICRLCRSRSLILYLI